MEVTKHEKLTSSCWLPAWCCLWLPAALRQLHGCKHHQHGDSTATTDTAAADESNLGYEYGEHFHSDEPVTYTMFFKRQPRLSHERQVDQRGRL